MNFNFYWRQFIDKYFNKFPLVGGLVNCTAENHKFALGEFLSTLFFSFLPLFVAYLVSWLKSNDVTFWKLFFSNVANGELFLYTTSLLAPVFFIVMKRRSERQVFPSKATHILIYGILICIAAIVFALKRVEFSFDEISLSVIQNATFLLALSLFYLALVYNNSLLPNPAAAIRDEEDEFSDSLTEHRRAQ